jgi:hypothetical protein
MITLTVGTSYPKKLTQQGSKLNYYRGDRETQWELSVVLASPQPDEIRRSS